MSAYVSLLVAEVEYLRNSGWIPVGPTTPGGDVLWKDTYGRPRLYPQDKAILLQKQREPR